MKRKSIERYMIHRKRNERNIMQPGYSAAIIRRRPDDSRTAEAVAISDARIHLSPRFLSFFLFPFVSPTITSSPGEGPRVPHPAGRRVTLRNVCVSDCRWLDLALASKLPIPMLSRPVPGRESIPALVCLQTRASVSQAGSRPRLRISRKNSRRRLKSW